MINGPHGPFRLRAVSFLNTVPLVWGMLHGPQAAGVDLSFSIPSECARDIENGACELGLVPVAEIARQGLQIVSSVGIACRGPVRSILLFSRVPWQQIRTLAVDSSSRTSVELARVILRERYGVVPVVTRHRPALASMLAHCDAALIIGDPALLLDPEKLPYQSLDLGEEWFRLTGLPFVFAAWAGKPGVDTESLRELTRASYQFGSAHMEEIVEAEYTRRDISRELARRYLSDHIRFTLGPPEMNGLDAFLQMADLSSPVLTAKL